jgi:anthranilate phosphoribosyltransferase
MSSQTAPAPGSQPVDLRDSIRKVARGESLGREGARGAMSRILAGEATPAQIGALLMGISMRGNSPEEIAGFVEAMRAAAVRIEIEGDAMDLVGTGGDGACTINISTAAAIVTASCGVKVAKHGNRSITSRAGSADVLEALGIPIGLPPAEAKDSIERVGFGFLFAPNYHPAMRHAVAPRREMGIRTAFNILGPMTNPAGVRRQLLGVYEDGLRRLVAETLLALGSERVWVVYSPLAAGGGLDEIGIEGPTRVSAIEDGSIREMEIAPDDAGLPRRPADCLRGGEAAENARRILAVFDGARGGDRDAVVLNAAAALRIAGRTGDLRDGAAIAAEAIDSGGARRLVENLRRPR